MFNEIEGVNDDVLGIKLTGKITHEDYVESLIPHADELIKKHNKVKCLCIIGPEWEGYELEAIWDDTKFGISHWSDFTHIAIVTDMEWVMRMTGLFAPFFSGRIKIFPVEDLAFAKEWINQS